MSKYCPNCGVQITKETKFCIKCGTQVNNIENTKNIRIDEPVLKKVNPKYSSKTLKILLSILAIVVLSFVVRSYFTDLDVNRNSYSISKTLNQLVGEWKAPEGSIFKDNEVTIKFRKRGDVLVGEDLEKRVYIQLLPYNSTNFSGLVVVDGIDDDFLVDFYKKENKLVFFSTLTKSSWNLVKLKN